MRQEKRSMDDPGDRVCIFCSHPTRVMMTGRMMLELDVCRVLRQRTRRPGQVRKEATVTGHYGAQWVARYIFYASHFG